MRRIHVILIFLILLTVISASIPRSAAILEEEIIVLFDESHGQTLTYSLGNFTKAIDALNGSVLEYKPGRYAKYFVRILSPNSTLNYSTLEEIDILIIGNPGQNSFFSDDELSSLMEFTKNGGNLLLMCDPQLNESIYGEMGNPRELNKILSALNISSVSFSCNDSLGDTIFNENHSIVQHPYFIYVNSTEFSDETTISDNIERILTFSSSLIVKSNECVVATGDNLSYAIMPDGNYTYKTGAKPPWLASYTNGEFKVVLCGSTIMFSDLSVKDLEKSWIDTEDNKALWLNIIKWLTPLPSPINISNYFTITGAIMLILGVTSFLVYKIWRSRKQTS
ncbi:MAG: hypothetical protein ACTSXW_06440 [Candidatus Baldrarchaeia archaeon]